MWGVVALATLSGLLASLASGTDGAPAATPDESSTSAPGTDAVRTLLLVHRAVDGTLDLAVVVGVDQLRNRTAILMLPPPTMVEVPALQNRLLAELPALVDDDVLRITMMNATGVRIDKAIIAGDDLLARLLAPADPLPVEFRRGIRIDDESGTLGYPSGGHDLPSAEAFRVLLGEEAGGALTHQVTVQAVLEGWFERLATPAIAEATVAADPAASVLVNGARRPQFFETLPVEKIDAGDTELLRIRDDEASRLVVASFDGAALGGGDRPRVDLRNGTGTVGLTQRVAAFIVPAGGEIVRTDNVRGFGQAVTTVVYYRDEDAGAARHFVDVLGVGDVAKAEREVGVVDITVIVGADFETAHPAP
jgi:hypothetical protein